MTRAFTLIELLVVITIIVVLLALLTPAMDKAIYSAEKMICLANQRNMTQGCLQYALDQARTLPYYPAGALPSAYDWRTPWAPQGDSPRRAAGLGILVTERLLPETQLGDIAHCPNIDSSAAGSPPGALAYIGMDRPWLNNWGAGGSYWSDAAWDGRRILGSYNYRAASWFNAGKGWLRTGKLDAREVIIVDMPDWRFGGLRFIHPDGYNRLFADGHGAFLSDPNRELESIILTYTAGTGDVAGHTAARGAQEELEVYPVLSRGF